MSIKRWSMILLTMMMFGSMVMAGCASKDGGNAAGSNSATGTENVNATGLPIVKEPINLKFVTTKSAQQTKPHEELAVVKSFEEKTKVHIEWDATGQGYDEKKNLMFASGDLPDVFFGSESLNDSDMINYGSQGMLIPLEDLIDQYAPNIKKIMTDRPDIKQKMTAPDGHIYSIPTLQEGEDQELYDILYINKKWLDQLGLSIPTTTDEFEKVLTAFKAKDPNGNNKADELPFGFMYGNALLGIFSMYGPFGVMDTGNHMMVEDGKVSFVPSMQGYRDATAYFHRLYKAGLIDPESFTQDRKTYFSKGKNPDAPLYGAFVGFSAANVVGVERAKDYVPILPLKGPDGKQMWNEYDPGYFTRSGFAITSSNKHIEASMRWIDELYTERNSLEWNSGPIGVTLKEVGDGTFDKMPVPEGMTIDDFRHAEAPGNTSARAVLIDTAKKVRALDVEKERIDIWKQYKPFMKAVNYPNVLFTLEDTQRRSVLEADIFNHVKKMQPQWIINGNVEADWDSYINQLKKMGLDELVTIYQANYDRIMALK